MGRDSKFLEKEELEAFSSLYLAHGFSQERIVYDSVEVGDSYVEAVVSVQNGFDPPDGDFHFSVPLALRCISQLAIVFGCLDSGLTKKKGNHLLRNFTIKCRREIEDRTVRCRLELKDRRDVPDARLYIGRFDIAAGSFRGEASFILPLEQES